MGKQWWLSIQSVLLLFQASKLEWLDDILAVAWSEKELINIRGPY
jgi:hypothetical protein